MKKVFAIVLALVMVFSLTACGENPSKKSEGVMSYAQYDALEVDQEVVLECYVQAHQSWWDG